MGPSLEGDVAVEPHGHVHDHLDAVPVPQRGMAPVSTSSKIRSISASEASRTWFAAEHLLDLLQDDSPAGREDKLDRASIGHHHDDLGQAMPTDMLALRHFLGREDLAMRDFLEGDPALLQRMFDPGCGCHGSVSLLS